MIQRLAVTLLLAFWMAGASAQLRTIPQDAKRASMRHLQDMVVEVDGTPRRLAPGAQIRDADNRVILPVALPPASLVKYREDRDGLLQQVWILTPQEAAQRDAR